MKKSFCFVNVYKLSSFKSFDIETIPMRYEILSTSLLFVHIFHENWSWVDLIKVNTFDDNVINRKSGMW